MYVMKPTEQRKGKIWQKFYFVYEEKAMMKQKTLSTLASTATKYTHTKHKTETVFGTKICTIFSAVKTHEEIG